MGWWCRRRGALVCGPAGAFPWAPTASCAQHTYTLHPERALLAYSHSAPWSTTPATPHSRTPAPAGPLFLTEHASSLVAPQLALESPHPLLCAALVMRTQPGHPAPPHTHTALFTPLPTIFPCCPATARPGAPSRPPRSAAGADGRRGGRRAAGAAVGQVGAVGSVGWGWGLERVSWTTRIILARPS